MRAAALLLLAAAVLGACESRLPLEAGNAWRCDFSERPGERDKACAAGWVCGPGGRCVQLRREEIFPCEGACNYPELDRTSAGRVYPTTPRTPVAAVFTERRGQGGFSLATRAPASGTLERLNPRCLRREPAVDLPADVTAPQAMLAGELPGPGTVRFFLDGQTRRVTSDAFGLALEGVTPLERVSGLRYLRPTAGAGNPADHVALVVQEFPGPAALPGLTRRKAVGELDLFTGPGGQTRAVFSPYELTEAPGPAPLPAAEVVRDARVLHGEDTTRPLVLTDTGVFMRSDVGQPEGWLRIFDAVSPLWRGNRLALSAEQDVWAVVAEQAFNDRVRHSVAAWRVSASGPRELFPACLPCGAGQVEQVMPFGRKGGGVDVFCLGGDGAGPPRRELVRVVGAAGGICELSPVQPLFNPQQVSAFDDSGGVVVLGTEDGDLFIGRELAEAMPYFLDRAPTAVTRFGGRLIAMTPRYVAVEVPDLGMVAVPSTSGAPPSAVVQDLPGGFVLPGGRVVQVDSAPAPVSGDCPDEAAEQDITFRAGPALLGPAGGPAPGPYLAEAVHHELLGRTDLAAVAGDSLYFQQGMTLQPPGAAAPEGLIAQVTPEPNFPIRSLAVDQSSRNNAAHGQDVHGYLVTSRRLFEFSLESATQRWALDELHLAGGEPAAVSMVFRQGSAGRVMFRDGAIFTLPRGFPFVEGGTLGAATRVTAFASAGALTVALTDEGLFLTEPPDRDPDPVKGERYVLWRWLPLEAPGGHAGFEHGNVLTVPTDDALRPELFFFDRQGAVLRLGRVEP